LTVGERFYNFTTTSIGADTTEVDAMIEALHTAIRNIFPTVPLKYVSSIYYYIQVTSINNSLINTQILFPVTLYEK
jgi:hypothetical protein